MRQKDLACHFPGEDTLKLFGGEAELELTLDGDADASGFLGDDYGHGIGVL